MISSCWAIFASMLTTWPLIGIVWRPVIGIGIFPTQQSGSHPILLRRWINSMTVDTANGGVQCQHERLRRRNGRDSLTHRTRDYRGRTVDVQILGEKLGLYTLAHGQPLIGITAQVKTAPHEIQLMAGDGSAACDD